MFHTANKIRLINGCLLIWLAASASKRLGVAIIQIKYISMYYHHAHVMQRAFFCVRVL